MLCIGKHMLERSSHCGRRITLELRFDKRPAFLKQNSVLIRRVKKGAMRQEP